MGDAADWFAKHVFDTGHVQRQREATEFSHGPGRVVPWVEQRARAQHRNPEPSDGHARDATAADRDREYA
ncbi:hypothetical protein [Mycobacterium intracellulare]|uniref:hypothetical protein n=1 Tax=Mycobacterium intracellulare TaxID=1767 RepID=UPI0034D330B3